MFLEWIRQVEGLSSTATLGGDKTVHRLGLLPVSWSRVPEYLGSFKQQIPIPSCDPEGVAIRHAIGTNLAIGERLQGLGLALPVQRHRCSSNAQPQLLGKASS